MQEKKDLETPVQNSDAPVIPPAPDTGVSKPVPDLGAENTHDLKIESKKRYIFAAVGAGIVLAATLGFLLWQNYQKQTSQPSPTPEPTAETDPYADWKTYTNKKSGYTLKYPVDWILKENEVKECVGPQFMAPSQKSWLDICTVFNENGLEAIKKLQTKVSDLTLSDHKAIQYEFQQFDSQREYSVNVENTSAKDLLWLHMIADTSEHEDIKKVFNQILSTFKFTE